MYRRNIRPGPAGLAARLADATIGAQKRAATAPQGTIALTDAAWYAQTASGPDPDTGAITITRTRAGSLTDLAARVAALENK